ncbi:hypothetical protein GQ43DRAFT_434603 [Delitschia confertaspora ATCC 74209]|uniref:Uncharacterized protein n=1 Tax=Delitschia confertaspora ATCC 74209 TaxID=1513339 RepID=A0A9P4JIY9_9PLEO|nr:hypothetical protein GQ43DRAFT_434603 [Delitschia confertaspora ATCC 74209]
MGFRISFPKAYERLDEICDSLSRLGNLKTFSLTLEEQAGEEQTGKYTLPGAVAVRILNTLQPSVINLDMDCWSLDYGLSRDPVIPAESHVCEALGNLFERLHYLRLHISYLCPQIFSRCHSVAPHFSKPDAPSPAEGTFALRYAVIHLNADPSVLTPSYACRCRFRSRAVKLEARHLTEFLRILYEGGAFPFLERFVVIDLGYSQFHAEKEKVPFGVPRFEGKGAGWGVSGHR